MKIELINHDDPPWPDLGMTSLLWMNQPVVRFDIEDLVLTQPGVLFKDLFERVGNLVDPYPHVVIWKQTYYLQDGHHRAIAALIIGQPTIYCRTITP